MSTIRAFWGHEVRNPGKVLIAVKALVNTGSEGKTKEIKSNKTKQCYLPCCSVEKQTKKWIFISTVTPSIDTCPH